MLTYFDGAHSACVDSLEPTLSLSREAKVMELVEGVKSMKRGKVGGKGRDNVVSKGLLDCVLICMAHATALGLTGGHGCMEIRF